MHKNSSVKSAQYHAASDLRSRTEGEIWVGHRGYPQEYPENSLLGLGKAIAAGAQALEIDIQASADGRPMMFHDADLQRMTGRSGALANCTADELAGISAHEPYRLGGKFDPCPIAELAQVVDLLGAHPQVLLFVELKPEIFDRWRRAEFIDRVWQILQPIHNQCVLISYDLLVLRLAQDQLHCPVGWVLSRYNAVALARLQSKPLDFVICNVKKLPPLPEQPWPGPWQWFVYDIVDAQTLNECRARGIRWLETWDIGGMPAKATQS